MLLGAWLVASVGEHLLTADFQIGLGVLEGHEQDGVPVRGAVVVGLGEPEAIGLDFGLVGTLSDVVPGIDKPALGGPDGRATCIHPVLVTGAVAVHGVEATGTRKGQEDCNMTLLFGALFEATEAGHQLGAAVGTVAGAGVNGLFHAYRIKHVLSIVRNQGR
ncbi:hypothetical protein D3C85_1093210 [compost metagenome]